MRGMHTHLLLAMVLLFSVVQVRAAESEAPPAPDSPGDVMSAFNKQEVVKSEIVTITDKEKRQVMFFMGVPLLIFILITIALGIAMGVYGKPVYVPHMVFAGLSATLALAHAVVGIVWFYPF